MPREDLDGCEAELGTAFPNGVFNLQQTADSIEQHATALELGIAPYSHPDENVNLESFATTVEGLRAEQRMREQQLDQQQQPQQGRHEVM
jgi:HPt (histidine-containing phosphotransfer) domain-containing protein